MKIVISFVAITVALLAKNVTLNAADHSPPNTLTNAEKMAGWRLLFDGQTLTDWKASENPASFAARDGMIVAHGQPRSHLYYAGSVNSAKFKDFEFQADVKTEPDSNGGIYFHTCFVENNWPQTGFEVQINNTKKEKRKTGSLYAIQDVAAPPIKEGEWFNMHIVVRDKRVIVKINGETAVDWTQPADFQPPKNSTWSDRRLASGTFALQAHDPKSVVYYRNIRVKPLDASAPDAVSATRGASSRAAAWQRWEHALSSSRGYDNPNADVMLRVTYTGPSNRTFGAYGFWDGGEVFRICAALPEPGIWHWETTCSDATNRGLHQQRGTVDVSPYRGDNPLYQHGFLKVSDDRRYLAYGDATPFLWMGDTAWAVPMRANDDEWSAYLADRQTKHFTLLQIAPASRWAGETDRQGEKPFHDQACERLNPAFWQTFERRVQRANEAGFVVLLVGLMEPVDRYPQAAAACLFARNIVARLFGNFVIFSPSFDSPFMPLADEVGLATREATSLHLITQHPGTPSREPTPIWTMQYYDRPYLDIAGVQTGHNGGNRQRCAHHAIEWISHAYRHEPHKPVVNLEAMYDGQGEKGWQAVDARSLAWRSWLSGAMGYTYGAGDVRPKVPRGGGGVWKWVTDSQKYDYWAKALQWESAAQMRHLHDFLAAIEWWRLTPAHDLIRNQPDDVTRRMVLAKAAKGDLAVAYLPRNESIELDLSTFPAPLGASWFDPVHGRFTAIDGRIEYKGTHRFVAPSKGDWVLLLR